jgi:hypothetical protein
MFADTSAQLARAFLLLLILKNVIKISNLHFQPEPELKFYAP